MSFPTDIKSAGVFSNIQLGISSFPDVAAEVVEETGKVFQFCIKGGAKDAFFVINLRDTASVTYSDESNADVDVTITMEDSDYMDMVEGRLDGMSAFMQGKLAIDGDMGAAQMFGSAVERLREAAAEAAEKATGGATFPKEFKSSAVFERVAVGIAKFPDVAKEVTEDTGKVFQFDLRLNEDENSARAYFVIDLKNTPSCSYSEVKSDDVDVTIAMTDQDYLDMAEGRLDGMSAFMQGKLSIDGDMGAAQMLGPAMEQLQAAAAELTAKASASTDTKKLKSTAVFDQIAMGISSFPETAKEIAEETGKVFQFCIKATEDDDSPKTYFLINLDDNPSCTNIDEKADADVTITMADEDYVDLVEGRLDGMSAFMQGKLSVEGDMGAAQMFGPAIQQLREAADTAQKSKL